jgi:hypothetical protein
MGNSQSTDGNGSKNNSNAASPTSPSIARHVARRKSAHTLSSAHAKLPTASLISNSHTATQPTRAHAHATVAQSPSHTRARSINLASTTRSRLDDSHSQRSDSSIMGSESSKHQRPPSRTSTLPNPSHTPTSQAPSPSPSTRPVDVPQQASPRPDKDIGHFTPSEQIGSASPYGLPPSNFSRPPRLPLPIEEVHTPGSPIITPQDISSPIGQADINGLPRRASVLSSTTVDDDDAGDNEAFTADQASLAPSVPMTIEWKGPGDKVYVTGTFVQWDRKFKLHRDKENGGFSTVLQLKPGTHHLKFLVDADMTTSHDLPTTVDYTNILVNYIEVVAPLPESAEKQAPAPAEPMPIPGAAMTQGQVAGTEESAAQSIPFRTEKQTAETEAGGAGAMSAVASTGPPSSVTTPSAEAPQSLSLAEKRREDEAQQLQKPTRKTIPAATYTKQIPQFLLDLDTYNNPNDERFQRSSRVINTLPQPPSLPLFLGKSILNGNTPHKDDASVLIMPNHTVLNHLATSSIKNGVLATSGTTRYKRKVRPPEFLPLRLVVATRIAILTTASFLRPSCTNPLLRTDRRYPLKISQVLQG